MQLNLILTCLFLFLYIFKCDGEINYGNINEFTVEELRVISESERISAKDSISTVLEFTEQGISYIAPQSGSVYLVWKTINHPLEESVLWNDNTRLNDGLMYTQMEFSNDTFTIRLQVLKGSVIEYYFWITKNKQGTYQDLWDLQAGGKTTVTEGIPVVKKAVYTKVEVKNESGLLSKGWFLFLLLVFVFGVLKWIEKRWPIEKKTSSKIERVFFIGLSLAVFHSLARSEIININPLNIFNDVRIIAKIIKGSVSDFLFVGVFTGIFIIALRLLKNKKAENAIYLIFIVLALFSTLVAFINISIVVYLGKPFTYQWLYYCDFLGSNEAKTVFQENLSFWITVNLILLGISTFILAEVLRILFSLCTLHKQLKCFTYALIGLGFMGMIIVPFKTKTTWTKGQSENAIAVMIWSVFKVNSNSTFFSTVISDEFEYSYPANKIKNEPQYTEIQNHKVKNVLFVVLESAGAVYFDAYGGAFKLSPNLNRYLGQSLIFDQMYAHAPATNRSLVSILGSMYPYLSYKSLTQEMPGYEHPTISSVLKGEGYRTSFFSSADLRFQNCKEFLTYRDFDVVEDFSQISCSDKFHMDGSNYSEGNGIDDLCLAQRLTSWLDEDSTKNFFSMIWTVQGHYPYYFSKEEEDFGVSDIYFNRYLNCLKHNDELIGNVMQLLEDRGLDSTTLVVVTGDHGEAFGQHGQYGHGTALYEENVKVPLFFINSGLFHGERKSDIAGLNDLAPTVLSVLNIEVPDKWQGRDLKSIYSNEAFYFAPWSDYLFGYRKDNMKYIFNETRNTVEVYDLNNDSGEKINLLQTISKEELTKARRRIAAWVQFQDEFIKDIFERQDNEM